jgi:hypothetical protein
MTISPAAMNPTLAERMDTLHFHVIAMTHPMASAAAAMNSGTESNVSRDWASM